MKQSTTISALSKFYANVLKQLGIKKETPAATQKLPATTSTASPAATEPIKPRLWTHSAILEESNRHLGITTPSTALQKRLEEEDRNGSISIQFIRKSK
ncbi:MAG: hypothetical protein ABL870_12405 [Sediminibacterium sp.]